MGNSPNLFRPSFPVDYDGLRQVLSHNGYSEEALAELIGGNDLQSDRPVLLRRTAGKDAFALLTRLFLLGDEASVAQAQALFAPLELSSLVTCGILGCKGNVTRASAKLVPAKDFFVFSDFSLREGRGALRKDHVLGVGAATTTLSSLTPGRVFRSALDLGTGCGIQALRAARHCSRLIATDVNPRALNFAAMNARLNNVANIEFREGSFFEPVGGLAFDLIVSNPPFVISPEQRFVFSDGAAKDGDVSEYVVRNTPRFLNDGGIAVILINWHHASENDWSERPLQWMEANGCDNWLLKFRSADPLTYAADWLRPTERFNPTTYGAMLDDWLAYYRGLNMQRFSAGAVVLRKREAARHWTRSDSVPFGHHTGHCGGQIERVIAAETILASMSSERDLLTFKLRFHPDHVLQARLTSASRGWEWSSLELRPTQGMSLAGTVDTIVMAILNKCDDTESLGAILRRTADDLGMDFEELTKPSLRVMTKLLRAGFLVAEETAPQATQEHRIFTT